MPYDIVTGDGIKLTNIPDGIKPDDQRLRALVSNERYKRAASNPDKEAAARMATEGMSGLDLARANLGAGLADFGRGARQLLPFFKSPDDTEIKEARAQNAALAKATETGAGADWMPSAGSALQFVGETLPSLAVPAGAATGVAARVLPRAAQALVSTPMRAGMTGGAVAGAFTPTTTDESRTLNTVLGTAAGAALPAALGAGRWINRMRNPQNRAGEELLDAIGERNAPGVVQEVQNRAAQRAGQSPATQAIPESLAEASGNTGIARLEAELGRLDVTQDDMAAHYRAQNVARYNAAQEATREADQLAGRDAVRGMTTRPMRQQALAQAGQAPDFYVPALNATEAVLAGDAGANPAVQQVGRYVLAQIHNDRLTPGRLYQVRKVLADRLEGPAAIGDEIGAAVRSSQRETMRIIRGIDEALNRSSGGQWGQYLSTYSRASRGVDESRAAQEVRNVIHEDRVPELGGAPHVTQTLLARALRASEGGAGRQFPLELSPPAREGLGELMENITRSNEVQRTRKLTGSAGGGSQTSTDIDRTLRQLAARGGGIPGLNVVLEAMGRSMSNATKLELVRLVQNPQAAVAAINAAQARRAPLSEAQRMLLQALSMGSATGAPKSVQYQ